MSNSQEWRKNIIERLTKFAVKVILLANKLPKTPAGFAIATQLVKSGTSIGANFIESQDASSTKDFIQKLSISLREARETWYWLTVIGRADLIESEEIKNELEESNQLIAILVTSIKSAKKKNI
ncbi:MAG TPA: four helix bundle protein [Candidatus Saccharimonadales bacterium]|nr:four helix bundle protein [Candidatus Saccharimonadales bacterium]